MTFNEDRERLLTIVDMIDKCIDEKDMLISTRDFLYDVKDVALTSWVVDELNLRRDGERKIIISCDAICAANRGAAIATRIEYPGKEDMEIVNPSPAKCQDSAEYESIFVALVSLANLINRPRFDIEVRSDGKSAVNQINGIWDCPEHFLNKRDAIRELVKSLPTNVRFVWRPRNSTESLKWAEEEVRKIIYGGK